MDFDTAKENIQPLRHGRRADRLELALGNEKELLDQERKQHEELIESSKLSQDPLGPWYEYICWIEQSYLKSGVESGLDEAISRCLCLFENEPRYKQDRRLIKLFIKYIDTQENPQELYNQLYMNGIGTMVADLYIAWSHYYDASDDFKQTETIFRRGLDAGAQPYDELAQAHQNFSVSMSQRIIYNDEESKKKFQVTMEEKRGALTMLRAHKKKNVPSIRTGFNVLNENPGRYESSGENETKAQIPVKIHEDDGSQPSTSGSIIKRNIVDGAKKKNENFLEPGPWSKVKMKTGIVSGPLKPGFEIMEDDINALPPIRYTNKLYEKGAQIPDNFVSFNDPQKANEKYNMIVEEPVVPNVIPSYEKFSMYPNDFTEISPEEVRGFRWFVKKEIMDAPVVEKYAHLLLNNFESGSRLFPYFPRENMIQPEIKFETELEPQVIVNIQLPVSKLYDGNYEVKSMEELLADKYHNGQIKLMDAEDFEEDLSTADMELTLVHHGRQSVHPLSRKSFVPRKSILRKSIMPPQSTSSDDENDFFQEKPKVVRFEDPKVEAHTLKIVKETVKFERKEDSDTVKEEFKQEVATSPLDDQRMSLKRKLETPDKTVDSKNRFVSDTPPAPPRPQAVETKVEVFKPPFPPIQQDTRKSTRGFEILDDEDTFCSTQQFNFFVKASSISTPNNSKKTIPRLVSMQPIPLHESPEKLSPPQASKGHSENEESPNFETAPLHQHQTPAPKQLSTIMETTETTHSTKSTLENETTLHSKTPMSSRKRDVENEQSRNAFDMFRIPEEQTETQFQKSIKLPRACEINEMSMQKPLPMIHGGVQSELSQMFIPQLNVSDEEIPASQELSPVELKESIEIIQSSPENLEIPATQEEFHLEIPATQDVSHMINIPPLMNTSEIEIPITEKIHEEFPATQELPELNVSEKKEEEQKTHQLQFQIYEDSFSSAPPPLPSQAPTEPEHLSETKHLHLSCKENFGFITPKYVERVASDEFLALCVDSPEKSKKNEQSDLLKFSTHASIEGSFKAMELNPPKSASPTMNIFEDDLNTEKFKFPLNGEKNSTLLYDVLQKKSNEKFDLNLSLEMNEAEINLLKSKDPVFKVPSIPALKQPTIEPTTSKVPVYVHNTTPFSIFEDSIKKVEPPQNAPSTSKKSMAEEEVDDDDDLSKSIFYKNYEKEVIQDSDEISDGQLTWDDQAMCSFIDTDVNRYEYTIIQTEEIETSIKLRHAIEESNGDPFCQSLRNVIMEQVDFEKYLEQHVPQCKMLGKIPQLKRGMKLEVNCETFSIGKFIAKGSFGSIFIAEKDESKELLAVKQEKPANLWEYFICMELGDRLKSNDLEHMLPAFMQINYAIIGNNASVFFTEFSPFGTIIDVCNKIKKVTGRHMDEYIGIVLTTQLLSIIDFLHACHIIHADIKPDNFLLLSKVELGSKVPALQLIDFGAAIDMEVYSKTDQFKYVVKTEYFTCCEMLEKKPWTYQTDLFGLAGTAHVMLFGKYMEVEKKIGKWDITSRYPRYFQKDLWSVFFSTLLNVPDSFSMPNLQELKEMLLNAIACRTNYVADKLNEFNSALLS